jgi:hypothetical protein
VVVFETFPHAFIYIPVKLFILVALFPAFDYTLDYIERDDVDNVVTRERIRCRCNMKASRYLPRENVIPRPG